MPSLEGGAGHESLRNTEIVKPIAWKEISAQSESDVELVKVRKWLRNKQLGNVTQPWSSIIRELWEECNVIMRGEKIVLPSSLRGKAIELAHNDAHQW